MRKTKTSLRQTNQYPQAEIHIAEVPDPYEPGAVSRVTRNIREHPLLTMEARGRITMAQRVAGETFQRHWLATLPENQAIDYSRQRVDGGFPSDGLTERRRRAVEWLNEVARYPSCGGVNYAILTQICGEGHSIQDVAKKWERVTGLKGNRAEGWVSGNLLVALNAILECKGMVAVGRKK